jgi:dihydrolipoamide dehydrogenase
MLRVMNTYDVIVIGGGPAGYNAAIRAGQLGLRVACVEGRPTLGGTCLNVGCMPSKALLHASELYEDAAGPAFAKLGIEVKPMLNLAQMMLQKDDSVAALTRGIEHLFRKHHVEWIRGWAQFETAQRLHVALATGEALSVEGKNIVIATGSEPTPLPGVAVDNRRILDSTGALALAEVPGHLVVIGAGVIGLELGSVWRRLGSRGNGDRVPGSHLSHAGRGNWQGAATLPWPGRAWRSGWERKSWPPRSTATRCISVLMRQPVGSPERLSADCVLVAIGRRPYVDNLGLEAAGLAADHRGMLANSGHRSAVPGIWVIGDVTSGPMLAHKAEEEAIACIEVIAGQASAVNYAAIPNVIYTRPEVAWVGKSEEELKAEERSYKVGKFSFLANARAKINHETEGLVKVLADAESDRILGVHMLGPGVSEQIAECALGIEFSASAEDLALTCHPHPTRSEALRQAAMDVHGWMMQA